MSRERFLKILEVFVFGMFLAKNGFAQSLLLYSETTRELNKIKIEERLEERLRKTLVNLLQDENVIVITKITLIGEKGITKDNKRIKKKNYVLPGVPVEKKLTEESGAETKTGVKEVVRERIGNINVWIFVSKEIPKQVLEKVKKVSMEILGINIERGDTISIETYASGQTVMQKIGELNIVKWSFIIIFSILMFIFLFGPFRESLQNLNRNLSSYRTAAVTGHSEGILGVEQAGQHRPEERSSQRRKGVFDFINKENINDIVYVLSNAPVEDAIVLLNNSPENIASRIFSNLPTAKQRQIVEQLKETKFLEPQVVESVDKKMKNKVNYIYGGVKRLSRLIQGCDKSVRESIIEWLRENDVGFAGQIQGNLIEFEDILTYEDQSFRMIFREVDIETITLALKPLPDEIKSQFFTKLNPAVVALIKEQMELIPVIRDRSMEAQYKIISVVDRLIREGIIERVKKE